MEVNNHTGLAMKFCQSILCLINSSNTEINFSQ